VRLLLPEPSALDDAGLRALYAPDRRGPTLRANFVTSLDGAVEVGGYSRGLSDDVDRAISGLLRRYSDAVMVGAGTLRHEGYGPVRVDRSGTGLSGQPTLVVVSTSLDLDPTTRTFAEAPVRPIVLTHDGAPSDRREALTAVADVVSCGSSVVDLAAGLSELHRRGLRQVLCEGGPHLFDALLAADLVDELCLTVSPLLAGAGADRIVVGVGRTDPLRTRLAHLIEHDGTLFTRYVRA
jgi:riboflavin biosynthesis pyrimidine reductase